jgi:hypothetical protein
VSVAAPQVMVVCGRCLMNDPTMRRYQRGSITYTCPCFFCDGEACWLVDMKITQPRIVEHGVSPVFSTTCELQRFPVVVWDVNSYYHRLGVSPDATKVEIRKAYQAGGGPDNERLTYIVKVLLDDEKRALYDSLSLGELYIDKYIFDTQLERFQRAVAEELSKGEIDPDTLEQPDMEELFDEVVESMGSVDRDRAAYQAAHSAWGYYTWQSSCTDVERLAEWRSLLTQAFWKRGVVAELGVGFLGANARREEDADVSYCEKQIDDVHVVLFSDTEEPNAALVDAIAAQHGA